ncbi:hypothetical protein K440DRAFT_643077 [Wilcoxina mikolae CBS 423.85]|nr:hypothetical protein K440DRAFT_643077 [Wilcoxina mikolae CBS 423.85]
MCVPAIITQNDFTTSGPRDGEGRLILAVPTGKWPSGETEWRDDIYERLELEAADFKMAQKAEVSVIERLLAGTAGGKCTVNARWSHSFIASQCSEAASPPALGMGRSIQEMPAVDICPVCEYYKRTHPGDQESRRKRSKYTWKLRPKELRGEWDHSLQPRKKQYRRTEPWPEKDDELE